ncbi:MAG: MerR family DNA-binding transcriptional regulator [Chloroflexota bacterium]|nr:MerR family DNA-binding transcriptional regulator [Chloroflexota bacterium]
MAPTTALLTDEEQQTIKAVLPAIRRTSPDAARILNRLMRAIASGKVADASLYASVTEVAAAFDVTPQTIRNWADRGWLPSERTMGGARRIPRSALASAQALARPRPATPDLSPEQIAAIINAPRRAK